jgi:hypothetical protein
MPLRPGDQPCKHDGDVSVYLLCDACRDHRRRVRDRVNHRKIKRPAGSALLTTETVASLLTVFTDLDGIAADLHGSGRRLTPDEDSLLYALGLLQNLLQPALTAATEELVEFKRPTTMHPDTYTPRRTKAIGPHLLGAVQGTRTQRDGQG